MYVNNNNSDTEHYAVTSIDFEDLEIPSQVESLNSHVKDYSFLNLGKLDNVHKSVEISIPLPYKKDQLCQTLMWYLTTKKVARTQKRTINNQVVQTRSFFNFIVEKKFDCPLPFSILKEYKLHITKESGSLGALPTQNKAFRSIVKPLEYFAKQREYGKERIASSLKEWNLHAIYLSKAGKLGNNLRENQKARDSLSGLFSDCPYNETELIDSLRAVASTLLLYFSKIRSDLKSQIESDHKFSKHFEDVIDKFSIDMPPISQAIFRNDAKGSSSEVIKQSHFLYNYVSKWIINTEDAALVELWSLNLGKVTPVLSGTEQIYWSEFPTYLEMKKIWDTLNRTTSKDNNFQRSITKSIEGEKRPRVVCKLDNMATLTLRDFLTVSQVEQWLMLMLKNVDGKYDEQALSMSIDDHIGTGSELFGRSIKRRRKTNNRTVISSAPPKESLLYLAYQSYMAVIIDSQLLLPEEQREKLFPNYTFKAQSFRNSHKPTSQVSKLMFLLSSFESNVSKFLEKELTRKRVAPFVWLMQSSISERKSLPASAIRNSAIIMKESARMRGELNKETLERDAEFSGQSELTRLNTYMSRIKSREVFNTVSTMEKKAIELMEKDARAILLSFESKINGGLEVLSSEEIEKLRKKEKYKDVNTSHSKLYKAFEVEEELSGLAYRNGHLFFIESPMSVAFMLTQVFLKLEKINRNSLNAKQEQNLTLLTEIVVLQYVLNEKFDKKIVNEGEALFEELIKPTLRGSNG